MLNEALNTSSFIDKIHGHVTVELFDAMSGKLVEKQEKHNFIANSGKEYLRYLQRVNFKSQISALYSAGDIDQVPINTFDAVVLSTSTALEDPADEWIMPGSLVGYATKSTYSGASAELGSPNGTLCSTSSSLTKWVFDWPVSAANGTIGSIGWMSANYKTASTYNTNYTYLPSAVNNSATLISTQTSPFSYGQYPIAYASDSLLFAGNGTTVTVYGLNMAVITSFTTISCSGLAWDSINNKLWVISGSQIASYNQTGTVINPPVPVTARAYRGLTYDGTNLWSIVNLNAYCINTAGADVSNFATTFGTLGTSDTVICDIAWDSQAGQLIVMASGLAQVGYSNQGYMLSGIRYSTSGSPESFGIRLNPYSKGGVSYGAPAFYRAYSADYMRFFDVVDTNTLLISVYAFYAETNYASYPQGSSLMKIRLDGMGSRVLLPSPITKTNSQTLRVTYQMDYT